MRGVPGNRQRFFSWRLQLKLGKHHRQLRGQFWNQPLASCKVSNGAITSGSGLPVHAALSCYRIDDPQLGDPEHRVETGLTPEIIDKAGIGNLDDELGCGRAQSLPPAGLWIENEIRLEIG